MSQQPTHTENWTQDDHHLNQALKRAHKAAMERMQEIEPTPPDREIAISDLDGRKRFVRRFKHIANETNVFEFDDGTRMGNRRFEHPNAPEEEYSDDVEREDEEYGRRFRPFTLEYDNIERCYILRDRKIDESDSMAQKLEAYEALHEALGRQGYAEEGVATAITR